MSNKRKEFLNLVYENELEESVLAERSDLLFNYNKINELAENIADLFCINPDDVNLSIAVGGWIADVHNGERSISGKVCKKPEPAMQSLLDECRKIS